MDELRIRMTATGGWTQEAWDGQRPGTLEDATLEELVELSRVLEGIPLGG